MSTQPEKKASPGGQSEKLLLVTAPPYGRAYEGALARLARDRGIQIQECDTHMDAVALLRKTDFAVLLCHSSTPEELLKQVNLLKLLAPQIKQKRLRVMATTAVKHESASTSLNFYGASEMLTEPISEKALQFKLERMARALAQVKARTKSKATSSTESSAGADAKKEIEAERGGRAAPQLVRKPALGIASDFWITAELEVKRIRDRWLIHLVGPSPDLGKWMRCQNEPPGRQGTILWQWIPNEPEGRALFKEEGDWFFRGQRPEFQELEWLFIGVVPELFFKAGDKMLGTKIQTDERSNLLVARDSEASQALIPLVKDSLVNMGKKTFRKKKDEEDDLREREPGAEKKKKLSKEDAEEALEVKESPPLKLASDCWILADKKPKRIAQRWVTRMLGPTPDHGRWVRMGSSDLVWGWEPHDLESDPFIKEQGTWVFRGLPPKFQEDRWLFVADKPGLAFMQGGKSLGSKLAADLGGNLIVAKDSEQATAKLPVIEESLKKIFKNKAEQEGTAETEKEKHDDEIEEVLEAERKEERGEPEEVSDSEEPDEKSGLDEDEIEISSSRKQRVARGEEGRGEEDEDDLVAKPAGADRDEEELEASSPDVEESLEEAVVEEKGGRKRRRRMGGSVERSGELHAVQKGANPGKELSIELSPEGQGKELEAVQEGPGEGQPLEARTGGDDPGDELEATQEGPGEGEELKEAPSSRKRKKGGSVRSEDEDSVDHGKVTREEGEAEDLGEVTRNDEESGDLGEVTREDEESGDPGEVTRAESRDGSHTEKSPARPEDAKGIRAPTPPGPTLSPLALAFLMAELVNDRSKDLAHGASRYCAYLSASCGGLQIELWCKAPDGWICAAKSENAGETHEIEAAGVEQEPETRLHGADTLVTPIRFKGQVVGALVIHGKGTDGVKHEYAEAAARVACGVAYSFSTGAVAAAA